MKKVILSISIVLLLALACVIGFLSIGRAGGEIGFDAIVTNIDGNLVYATVTEDRAGFGSRKLPETIVIYSDEFPEYELQVGDLIDGCYIRKEHEGNFYRVVSIVVNSQD